MQSSVYLINLDGSDQRLDRATRQLQAEGLAFERVAAFDGRQLSVDQFPDYDAEAARKYMGRPMLGGEIGCYLSHLDCARRFLAGPAEHCVVFEDDMLLVPGTAEFLDQSLAWLASKSVEWHLMNIGARRHKIYTPLHEFDFAGQGHLLTRAHYFPMTTTGLVWSRQGASAFVSGHHRIFAPVDNYFRYWLTRSNMGLAVMPPLVTAADFDSEISSSAGPGRSKQGRRLDYGLIKQKRLMIDKAIALRHRWSSRKRAMDVGLDR